ncbi:MAG: hypothetical protein ACJ71K_21785 [Nitrososphaeraceae archaeon]
MQQRQKDLQNKIDTKISKEIYNVQKVLEVIAKQKDQSPGQDTDFIQCIETTGQIGEKENQQEQMNSNITNAIVKENKEIIDYKRKADWYASLLMYNSY